MPLNPLSEVLGPAVRDVSAAWLQFMGIPHGETDVPRTLSDFANQPADEAWVYRCMAIRAEAAQGVPCRVQVADKVNNAIQWVDISGVSDTAGEDLQLLLDDVNPAWHGPLLQSYMEAASFIHGGSYVQKVRGRLGGRPQELHWLPATNVEPKMGPSFPASYTYQPLGTAGVDVPAQNMIPLRETVNLKNPYKMLSPLSSARYQISVNRNSAEWNAAMLKNWGIPPLVWVAPKDSSIGQQDVGYIRRALRQLRGPQNQGKTPVLPGGLEPKVLSLTQKDADWLASGKVSRMVICAIAGVPLVLAGDDEKTSAYAVIRDAERVMWRLGQINRMDARAATLNSWLVPDFDPTRKHLRIAYDYTGIEALQPAPAEAMAQWNEAVKIGLPLNRFIAHFGMGTPVEGGDEPRILLRTGEIPLKDATNPEAVQALNGASSPPGPSNPTPPPASKPRPAEYNTARSIEALGKGLYRHAAVRAYIDNNDDSLLTELVPAEDVPPLIEGLRRRESAAQIAARFSPGDSL